MKQDFDQQDIKEAGSTIKFSSPYIEDIPKVNEDGITNFENGYKTNKLFEGSNNLLNYLSDEESNQSKEQFHFSILESYVKRNCPSHFCPFKNSPSIICSPCILMLNNIYWSINDDTVIYTHSYTDAHGNCSTSIPEQNIPSFYRVFSEIGKNEVLPLLKPSSDLSIIKLYLSSNPLVNWINNAFSSLCFEERQGILSFILYGEKLIINPFVLHETFGHLDNVYAIKQQLLQDNDKDAVLKNHLCPGSYSSEELLILKKRLFNHSLAELLQYSFPNSSPGELEAYIYSCKPTFQENINSTLPQNIVNKMKTNFINLLCQGCFSFQLFFPTLEELTAIFYFHRKFLSVTPEFKKDKDSIFYNNPIKLIHYNLAKQLIHKYHAADAIVRHNTKDAMFRAFGKKADHVFWHYFKISENEVSVGSDLSKTFQHVYNSYIRETENQPNKFNNLRKVLFAISNGNTKVIDDLAILLLKVYIGRSYLRHLDKNSTNLTICICDNKNYFKNFMMDIFNFSMNPENDLTLKHPTQHKLILAFHKKSEKHSYHVSTYSSKMLSDDKYLGEFIRDKAYGNIVNLDTTDTFTINGKFKSFLSGEKVSVTDPVFGKLSYRSNAQYIYITENKNLPESSFSGVPHSTLHFTGDLSKSKYEPLNRCELFFLVTGLLHYALDLIDAPSNNETDTFQSNAAVPSVSSLIDAFIDEFCDDTTGTISQNLIEAIPLESITRSKNEKERKEQVKKLQIDKLDFIFSEDLCSCFNKWLHITHPTVESCSDGDFTKMIIEKYHIIFYNKLYNENMSGKKQEARGFYGLKIKVDELEKSLSQENQKKMAVSSQESQKHFTDYLENIILGYYKLKI